MSLYLFCKNNIPVGGALIFLISMQLFHLYIIIIQKNLWVPLEKTHGLEKVHAHLVGQKMSK